MENVTQLWETLASTGLQGVVLGFGVFLLVLFGRFSGFVKDGKWARVSAAVTALLVGGASVGDVQANMNSIVAILISCLIHQFGEFIKDKKAKEEKASE